ncbi:MAG: bifunctional phosphopantothenoylcysteine decarboxylase/phosphopantothenate--cysteine ligase CoaBC [Thermodesulfobacteria bacterium]|nr:bifunctional phosphopantothenoylcysteine decarboxylase/phosphopantothenate--cysteine ligase CoaBC [Thermodesulfobacteriota bacterium]
MIKGKKILFGICGSIAIYKLCDVVRQLTLKGAEVIPVLTQGAKEFVSPLLFSALSGKKAYTDEDFFDEDIAGALHIKLAKESDLIVVAPATADFMAKASQGIADSLLLATLLASKSPVIFFPAMNTNMYEHKATQNNVKKLKEYGYIVYEPEEGALACGDTGKGRLPSPEVILMTVESIFYPKDLKEKKVLITGGATKEYIDDVRFITNASSGKMAYAFAKEAYFRGAEVTLVLGEVKTSFLFPDLSCISIKPPKIVKVNTTEEMFEAVNEGFKTIDIVVFASAPVDFKPVKRIKGKLKKSKVPTLELELTKDIAYELGKKKQKQIFVGFALEEKDKLEEYAKDKMQKKNFDIIIANPIETIGKDSSNFLIISKNKVVKLENTSKSELAKKVFDEFIPF